MCDRTVSLCSATRNSTYIHISDFVFLLPFPSVSRFLAVNWLQLAVASAAGGSRPLAGGTFVRGRGAAPDFATHLMLRHPLALSMVSKYATDIIGD